MVQKLKSVKALKGYKTILFNSAAIAVPIVDFILNSQDIASIIPTGFLPYYGIGIGLINIVLRNMTSTPVGKKI